MKKTKSSRVPRTKQKQEPVVLALFIVCGLTILFLIYSVLTLFLL